MSNALKHILLITTLILVGFKSLSQEYSHIGTEFVMPIYVRGYVTPHPIAMVTTLNQPSTVTFSSTIASINQTITVPADTSILIYTTGIPPVNWSIGYLETDTLYNNSIFISSTEPIILLNSGISESYIVTPKKFETGYYTLSYPHFVDSSLRSMPFTSTNTPDGEYPAYVITSYQDSTEIRITPTSETQNGWLPGNTYTITLNKGENWFLRSKLCRPWDPCSSVHLNNYNFTGTVIETVDPCHKLNIIESRYTNALKHQNCNAYRTYALSNVLPDKYLKSTHYVMPSQQATKGTIYLIYSKSPSNALYINNQFIKTMAMNESFDTILHIPSIIEGSGKLKVSHLDQNHCTGTFVNDTNQPNEYKVPSIDYQSTAFRFHFPPLTPYLTFNRQRYLSILTDTSNAHTVTLNGTSIPVSRFIPMLADSGRCVAFMTLPFTTNYFEIESAGSFQAWATQLDPLNFRIQSPIDTILPIIPPPPPFFTDTCLVDTITLRGNEAAIGWLWSTGDTTQTIRISSPNTYWVQNHYCTDTLTDTLVIDGFLQRFVTDSVCFSDSVVIGNQLVNRSGTYLDTVRPVGACDTIITFYLTVYTPQKSVSQTFCPTDSVLFGNRYLTAPGQYVDTFVNAVGCDTVVTLTLSYANPPGVSLSVSDTICAGDTLRIGSLRYHQSGIFTDTLYYSSGCDSIYYEVNLFLSGDTTYLYDTICDNDTLNFYGALLSQPGVYQQILSNSHGCDSLIELSLVNHPTYYWRQDTSFCLADSIFMINRVINQRGVNRFEFLTSMGCDSIIEINVQNHCPDLAFMPNSFSPNGDGTNDVFLPTFVNLDDVINYELRIFNRWGEQLFASQDPTESWDGNYKGTEVPLGTYIWKITYLANGKTYELFGHVNVVR